MTISVLPPVPQRTDLPADFVTKADAFVAHLPVLAEEINETAAAMNAAAAGGAFALPYKFSVTTTDSDPGTGYLRLSSGTQNTSTTVRLDLVGTDTKTYTATIDTFDDSSSVSKGQLKIVKAGDATKWLLFNVTSVASPTGYKNVVGTCVASSESNPFVADDALVVSFSRTGDKGDTTSNTAFTPQLIAAVDINCTLGNYHYKTVAGATTFTFSNIPAGGFSMTVDVQLDSGSIAWPASVKIARDQWPTLAVGKTHMFFLSTKDGGVRWRLTVADNFVN